ncbi:MAG TPA: nucleotidyltransferase family protein [Candidatus Limnocylindrales bacterium]|nr:nucleotidyltransferase family protein [Candidatus Limnocylindrales bacterium]
MPESPIARNRTVPTCGEILALLRAQQSDLERWGIRRAALFGSVARGEAHRGSDVDLLVELDPEAHIGLVRFVDLKHRLAELLGYEVDLVSRGGIRPDRDAEILEQAVWAF